MICPIRSGAEYGDIFCEQGECAWYDEIDYHCAVVTIADSLANIHGHARDCFAKAYGLDEALEDLEDEEEKDANM